MMLQEKCDQLGRTTYVSDPDDGNRWNNDTDVKMSVRNITVYTDRP